MTQSLPPKNLVLYADDDPDDIELEARPSQFIREVLNFLLSGMELKCFLTLNQ